MKHVSKVTRWLLSALRDAEHVEFIFALLINLRIILTDLPVTEVMLDNILVHYTREETAFKHVPHEILTGEAKELDGKRDDLFRSLHYMLKAYLRSHDPAKVAAAKTLEVLFNSYKAIPRANYDAETAFIRHFLIAIATAPYAAAATLLGFDATIAILLGVNNDFEAKRLEHLKAVGEDLMHGNVRKTRPAVNQAVFALTNTLDALYASNESVGKDPVLRAKLTAAINFINEEIHALVNVLANRGKHYPGKPEDLFDPDMEVIAPVVPGPPAPAPAPPYVPPLDD